MQQKRFETIYIRNIETLFRALDSSLGRCTTMKAIVFILGIAVAIVAADNCDNTFKTYLDALQKQIVDERNTGILESELADDYRKLAHQCFSDSTSGNKCYLPDSELTVDVFGPSGPLKECERCRGLASKLRDAYFQSNADTRKCFREQLSDAVRDELQPCIGGKLNDPSFRIPSLPDFDQNSFAHKDDILRAIGYRIMARSRLDACGYVNPAKAGVSRPCLDKEFSGIYAKHCEISKSAVSTSLHGNTCTTRFNQVKQATCQCMNEKRDEWHRKLDQVKKIIDEATSGTQCGQDIASTLGTWIGKLEAAIQKCLPGKLNTSLQKLFELACGQVVGGTVKKSELTTGFRFGRYFLDALNDRLTVFCDSNCV